MNSKILHAALFCPSLEGHLGLPILLWGRPGSGKTAFVQDAALRTGLAYERLSPAERGEAQFGVVPIPHADGLLHYPPPDWSQKFSGGGVIFVDEIGTAVPAIQAPLLGLVQLRTLGSYVFPKRTRVVAASNETIDGAGSWDLAPALANRFGHFEFEGLDSTAWGVALMSSFANMEGATGSSINAEVEEKRVADAWPGALATANGLVAAFIQRKPDLLHRQPAHGDAKSSRAWPSRRSVHYAATALASAKVHNLNEIDTDEFMAGFVGQAWVSEFRTLIANWDLPDPADLLDGKVQWKHDGRRLDRTLAVLGSCAGLVAPEKAEKRKERGNAAWALIATVLKDAADCAVPAARVMLAAKMTTKDFQKSWEVVGDRLHPLLVQAGVLGG